MKVYELEDNGEGVLSVDKGEQKRAERRLAKKDAAKRGKKGVGFIAAAAAVLGVAFEVVMGLPVYLVLAVVALFSLPAVLISRARLAKERSAR